MWKKDRESGWKAVQVPGAVASRVAAQGGSPIYRQMQIPPARGEAPMQGQPQTGITAEQRAEALVQKSPPRTDEEVARIVRSTIAGRLSRSMEDLKAKGLGGQPPMQPPPPGRAGPAAPAPAQAPLPYIQWSPMQPDVEAPIRKALQSTGFQPREVSRETAPSDPQFVYKALGPGAIRKILQRYDPEMVPEALRQEISGRLGPRFSGFERQEGSGLPFRSSPSAPKVERAPLLRPLPSGQMPTDLLVKPVSDGVIELQWDSKLNEFEATKYYRDGRVSEPRTGVGPNEIIDYLNSVRQGERELPPSQLPTSLRLSGPQGGGKPYIPSSTGGAEAAPAPTPVDRQVEIVRQLASTISPDKPVSVAEIEAILANAAYRPQVPKAPKVKAGAGKPQPLTVNPIPQGESRSLADQIKSLEGVAAEGQVGQKGVGAGGPGVFRHGEGLFTPGDQRIDPREQVARIVQELQASSGIKDNRTFARAIAPVVQMERASRGMPTPETEPAAKPVYDTGAREVQRRTTMPEESAFEVQPWKRGGEEWWQVVPKGDAPETNVFVGKEGKKYRVYLESGGKLEGLEGYDKDHLINAKLAAIKLAERQHYKEAVTSTSFRAPGVGEYAPIAPSADGKTMSYRFTPEGSATPVVPEKPMPMEQWDNLARKNGAALPPKPAERARKVGRPKENQPQVILKPAAAPGKSIRTVDLGARSRPIVDAVKRAPTPGTSKAERDALAAEIAAHRARYYEEEEQQ